MFYKILILFSVLYLSVFEAVAQDLHYSQFYNSPQNLNPALTGIFNGSERYTMSVRDQWRFVPVPWFTFSGSFDKNITPVNKKHFYGLGINFNYDRQGDSRLVLAGLNISGSITRELNKSNFITGGILVGINRRGFNPNSLTWDKQWNGDAFDPNLSSGEQFEFDALTFLESGAGINYRLQKSSRTKLDLGIGAYHLLRPKTNFYGQEQQKLPIHLTLSGLGTLRIASPFDIQLHFLQQLQEKYRETLFGGLGIFHLSQKRGRETQLHVGLGYRTAGSYIPTVALQFKQWYVGVSYDTDNTDFNRILNTRQGGPEVHIRYIMQRVKPMSNRKVCPIY
jgi:type IX secretion system PorP/SprF family membrane protein